MGLGEALERGYTLPADWYTTPAVFERERERIFHRSWQYAGAAAQVSRPGDFVTSRAGTVPLLAVRGDDGALNAFVNVCRHRGAEVVLDASGSRKTLQCHYHAWTYGLDGALRSAPRSAEQDEFDPAEFSLLPARAETWGPFLFVNPDPDAPPLAETLGELPRILADAGLQVDALSFRERGEYDIAANWKVVVDNYLECYHCAVAHPSFRDLIDLDAYGLTEYETFSVQRGPVKESARGEGPYRLRGGVEEGIYAFLWPNFTLNVYPGPGNVSVNLFEPAGPARTLARFEYFFAEEVPDDEVRDFVEFVDQVQREDTVLCESVQRGLASGRVEQGRLMLSRERGLQHFQRLVLAVLER